MSRASNADNEETPEAYARRLAKYISDPSTIRARTVDHWGRAPSLTQCANMRAKVEREKREFRKACEQRATPLGRYVTDDDFPCGHERSDDNTYYTGNREACRTCQREAQDKMRAELEWERARKAKAVQHQRVLDELRPVATPIHVSPRDRVLARAAELTGLAVSDIISGRRFRPLVRARFAVIHALNSLKFSSPQIARMVNIKDHTSILHAFEMINIRRGREKDFDRLCLELEAAAINRPVPISAEVISQFVREAA